MQWYGYDLDTGEKIWGPTASQDQWDFYSSRGEIAYGKLYSGGYSGKVYAYDVKNGTLLWTSNTGTCGLEGPYERWPINGIMPVDGKLYVRTGEHSHTH